MKKIISYFLKRFPILFIIFFLILVTNLLARNRGSGWGEGDLIMGSHSINGSSETGLYFDPDNDGTNEIIFSTNGDISATSISVSTFTTDTFDIGSLSITTITARTSEGMRFQDNSGNLGIKLFDGGNIGIGEGITGTAASRLAIYNATNPNIALSTSPAGYRTFYLDSTNGGDQNRVFWQSLNPSSFLYFANASGSPGTNGNVMRMYSDGNVGIGISSSPSERFEVVGNSEMDGVYARSSSGLELYDDGGNGIFIKDGGNVGIGTTNPSTKLNVRDSGYDVLDVSNQGIAFRTNNALSIIEMSGDGINSDIYTHQNSLRIGWKRPDASTENIIFYSSNTVGEVEYARFTGVGNLGIGTTTPSEKLEINGGNLKIINTASDDTLEMTNSSDDRAIYLNTGGDSAILNNLVIGSTSTAASEVLHVVGDILSSTTVQAPIGDFNQVYASTVIAKSNLYLNTNEINISSNTSTFAKIKSENGVLQFQNDSKSWENIVGLLDTVIIESEDDFPTAVGGVIQLESGKRYLFTQDVFTMYSFRLPQNGTCAFDGSKIHNVVYGGGSDLFISTTSTFFVSDSIYHIGFDIGLGSGTWANVTSPAPSLNDFIFCSYNVIAGFDSFGTIENVGVSMSYFSVVDIGEGLTLKDNAGIEMTHVSNFGWKNLLNTTMYYFVGDFSNSVFILDACAYTMNPNENAFYFNPISTFGTVAVTGGYFSNKDRVFKTGSLDKTAIGFKFIGNSNIEDSTAFTSMYYTGLSSTTVGSATPVNFITTWEVDKLERFVAVSTGTVTYIGVEDISTEIKLDVTVDPDSGAATTWTMWIYKNGVQLSNFPYTLSIPGGVVAHMTPSARVDLSTGDYLNIRIQRDAGTGNIITTDGWGRIIKL